MRDITIVQAPSHLGVGPYGIHEGSDALLRAGLAERIRAAVGARVEPAPFDTSRDPDTSIMNPRAISDYAAELSGAVGAVLDGGRFPLILGGDCSILLGPLHALQKRGRYGLLFLDGHMDFYQPEAEPNGEAASMEMALATGRGPDLVTRIGGKLPLVRDEDTAMIGFRDKEEAFGRGSQRLPDTILAISEADLRRDGFEASIDAALRRLCNPGLEGFWLHLDVDVLSASIMPAGDFETDGGLAWDELSSILVKAFVTGRVVGMEITIFNPRLDPSGEQAAALIELLGRVLDAQPARACSPAISSAQSVTAEAELGRRAQPGP